MTMTNEFISYLKITIFVSSLVPFLLELICFVTILRYKKYAVNINKNTNDFFRAIKLRYTNSAKLDIPIKNSRSFIEKSLLGKEGSLRHVIFLDRFCLVLVCLNLSGMTILTIKGHINFTYIISIISLCFYLFRQACDIYEHSTLIISLVEDYLENTLSHRVMPAKVSKTENITPVITEKKPPQVTAKEPSKNRDSSSYNNDIIESILQEFLA